MKGKRILAAIGVILLIAMYAATLVSALLSDANTAYLFKASLYCTVIVPVVIYAYSLITKLIKESFHKHNDKKKDESKEP